MCAGLSLHTLNARGDTEDVWAGNHNSEASLRKD